MGGGGEGGVWPPSLSGNWQPEVHAAVGKMERVGGGINSWEGQRRIREPAGLP